MDIDSDEDVDDFRPVGTPKKLLSKSPFMSSSSIKTPMRKSKSIVWSGTLENHNKQGLNDPRDSLKKLPSRSILVTPKRHRSVSAKLTDLYDDLSQRKRVLDAQVM
ncbi:unnamed protein product [Auanema sp. JU1783]|nr:unnamed protein product [Auanema sp. JU1783]